MMWLAASLFVLYATARLSVCEEGCGGYPTKDPCLPGGVWDPVLRRCTGIDSNPCYQCYSGEFCETMEDPLDCKLSSGGGNPVYLAEYWTGNHSSVGEPCTQIPGHYRPAYQFQRYSSQITENVFPLLRDAIVQLHQMTGNAETEGYSMVTGMGATMVLHTAVTAMAQKILQQCEATSSSQCPSIVDVFAQAPYYSGYQEIAGSCPRVQWNSSADPDSPYTIEILTYPNNPSGEKRDPLVKDPSRIIRDCVYYWPMYTTICEKLDYPITIFSSSKHGGLAGTRFGWGLVKDKELADSMEKVFVGIMLSYSVDVQLRVLNGLNVMIEEANKTQSAIIPFHEYGTQVMRDRFEDLAQLFSLCPGLTLTNQLASTGAYAWIRCSDELVKNMTCSEVLGTVNLSGISGSSFGATSDYVRLSMLLPTVEFDIMYFKLKTLCSTLTITNQHVTHV